VIACAVVPWVIAAVRSWPASQREDPHGHAAAPKPVGGDPWSVGPCAPELEQLRERPFWQLRATVHDGHEVFVVAVRERIRHHDTEYLLDRAQRAAILYNLRDQCAAGTVDRIESAGMPIDGADPVITFSPSTTREVVVESGSVTLRFNGYGATAR
jgi:hypothetical protein